MPSPATSQISGGFFKPGRAASHTFQPLPSGEPTATLATGEGRLPSPVFLRFCLFRSGSEAEIRPWESRILNFPL